MLQGFKQFMLRGNVLDLAVAVVMGAAFGAVVTALVKDLITPLIAAIVALHDGPDVPGSLGRDDIQAGLRSLHVARRGRRGRHFILYRASSGTTVEVIRILHDAMDFPRNLPSNP